MASCANSQTLLKPLCHPSTKVKPCATFDGKISLFAISFETKLVLMEQMVLLPLQVPLGDVDRIMREVVEVVRLTMVKFDSNAYQ